MHILVLFTRPSSVMNVGKDVLEKFQESFSSSYQKFIGSKRSFVPHMILKFYILVYKYVPF